VPSPFPKLPAKTRPTSGSLKLPRLAVASFKNAIRLHEDAILLFKKDRIPSALHTAILSIEELGKYSIFEHIWYHSRVDPYVLTIEQLQESILDSYSHTIKQRWFINENRDDERFISKPLLRILKDGNLERIKQQATYVGLSRKGKNIDFKKRMTSPFRTSKKTTEKLITLVNDYIVVMAVGIRKGNFMLDVPEIDNWLAQKEVEDHFVDLWPIMQPSAKRFVDRMRRYDVER
jgi:AbiV family abortive infection protein